MMFCLRMMSTPVMLSEEALPSPGAPMPHLGTGLTTYRGPLRAAGGHPHSAPRVGLMASSPPRFLQQPWCCISPLMLFILRKLFSALSHLLLTFKVPSLYSDLIEWRE